MLLLELIATASHAGNAGSNPARITRKIKESPLGRLFMWSITQCAIYDLPIRQSCSSMGSASITDGCGKGIEHQRLHIISSERLQKSNNMPYLCVGQFERSDKRIKQEVGDSTPIVEINNLR